MCLTIVFIVFFFFFSSRRRHTRLDGVTGVQTCALPISCAPDQISALEPHSELTNGGAISEIFRNFPILDPPVSGKCLSDQQITALELMIVGKSPQEIAQAVGVTIRTLYNWRVHNEQFKAEHDLRRRQLWGQT